MEQESKSMEIRTYHSAYPGSMYPDREIQEDGYVTYSDHVEAMKAAQDAIDLEKRALLRANAALREDTERMRVMREALEKSRHKLCYHLLSDGEMKDFRCDSCKIIDAALASTAPVAEAGQKEGECSPRCVAYEAGDRFAISHEDGCPNGGSK